MSDEIKDPMALENNVDSLMYERLSIDRLAEILNLTIKEDSFNKTLTFLCMLSAYAGDSQFNISFNAPSSTGKSYIPLEVAKLFPPEDVIEIGYCSPTAFFHDHANKTTEDGKLLVDLSKKILIFLDQPHTLLLQYLRPLLSHDKKEIEIKITDKQQRKGLKTKNIILRGFPAVIFCTAGLSLDEQEATRFILLSPETSQEKISAGISQKIKKETHTRHFRAEIDINKDRNLLINRIIEIKNAGINEISLESEEYIRSKFLFNRKILISRNQRDVGKIIQITKAFALLNLWSHLFQKDWFKADNADVDVAFELWSKISRSQELNIPPYLFQLYDEIICPTATDQGQKHAGRYGVTRQQIITAHLKIYSRPLADWALRQQILPMLESAGLIFQEADPRDKRRILIYPTT